MLIVIAVEARIGRAKGWILPPAKKPQLAGFWGAMSWGRLQCPLGKGHRENLAAGQTFLFQILNRGCRH
jgi:hypothetical protein